MLLPAILEQQLIWIVCFAFYLISNVYLLSERELLLFERRNGWSLRIAAIPFVLGGKHTYVADVFGPFRIVLAATWLKSDAANQNKLTRTMRWVSRLQRKVSGLRATALAAFVNLFVLGPTVTALDGLERALIWAAANHVCLIGLMVLSVTPHRAFFRLSRGALLKLSVEYVVCPGYLPNVLREVCWRSNRLPVDAVAFAFASSCSEERNGTLRAVRQRLDDMIVESDDQTEVAALGRYKSELRL